MIGQMRDRIIFKAPVNTAVPGAGFVSAWVLSLLDWAAVEEVKSNRTQSEDQTQLQDAMRFTIRYRTGWQPNKSMLIEYNGRDYTIQDIREVNQRGRYWRIVGETDGQPVQMLTS